jgi:hypothetical protein
MLSGNAPPIVDGVGDYTARLLEELTRRRPDWRWLWLAKRPRWFHSPIRRECGTWLFRPSRIWTDRGPAPARGTVRLLRPDILHVQEQIHSFWETGAAWRIAQAAPGAVITTLHEYHIELPSVVHTDAMVRASRVIIANDSRNASRCLDRTGREADHLWWSGPTVLPLDVSIAKTLDLVVSFGFLNALKSMELIRCAGGLSGRLTPTSTGITPRWPRRFATIATGSNSPVS